MHSNVISCGSPKKSFFAPKKFPSPKQLLLSACLVFTARCTTIAWRPSIPLPLSIRRCSQFDILKVARHSDGPEVGPYPLWISHLPSWSSYPARLGRHTIHALGFWSCNKMGDVQQHCGHCATVMMMMMMMSPEGLY